MTVVINHRSFFILLSLFLHTKAEKECNTTEDPYIYFSQKTSYEAIRPLKLDVSQESKTCSPVYIWMLTRHGTRYPGGSWISQMNVLMKIKEQILTNHKEGHGSLCPKELKNLEQWNFTLTQDSSNQLAGQGFREQIFTANRMKTVFNDLLKGNLSSDEFSFQSSNTSRTINSAIAFMNELLNTNYTENDGNNIQINEMLLHLNKNCKKYQTEVYKDPATYSESLSLIESIVGQELLVDVSKRLGYRRTLSFDTVYLMYLSCAYENAWSVTVNLKPPFCAAFSKENLQVLEYHKDIEEYYKLGYGNPLGEKMGCPLVHDMVSGLNNAAQISTSKQKGTFHFAHSETIQPLYVALGLYRDEQVPTHENYNSMKEHRKWRLSLIDPFGTNIFAILYNCSVMQFNENFKVALYQNERLIKFPGCAEELCPLQYINERYSNVYNERDCGTNFCEHIERSNVNKLSISSFLMISNIVFVHFFYLNYFIWKI